MKLEYLPDINPDYPEDDLIRLFDFDRRQAIFYQDVIKNNVLKERQIVDLSILDFIEPINCTLTLRLCDIDKGIQRIDNDKFDCKLTENSYRQMIDLLPPFVDKDTNGWQWLYDLSTDVTPTEFLFSPTGTW